MLEGLERDARETRNGLWADSQPVTLWEWRRRGTETAHGGPAPSSPAARLRPFHFSIEGGP